MNVGVVLISKDGFYLGPNGELPKRPAWDKSFITALATDRLVLCSTNTWPVLPPSIVRGAKRICHDRGAVELPYDVNFGIATFSSHPPDMLLVVHSLSNLEGGDIFDLTRLDKLYSKFSVSEELTIYVKVRE